MPENETVAFTALADPTRRRILEVLASDGSMTISDLSERFPITRQAVTRHLDLMEDAGLVLSQWQGRERVFSFHPEPLAIVSTWIEEQERLWNHRLAALDRHLSAEE